MQCNKVVLFPKSYLKYFNIICNSASSVTIATYFTYMLLWLRYVSQHMELQRRTEFGLVCIEMQLIMPNYLLLVHNVVSYGCAL